MSSDSQTFWKLYRAERKKLGGSREQLTSAQIVHAARAARKRMNGPRPEAATS